MRAQYELDKSRDPNLAIVLAAAGVDCELARIYFNQTRAATSAQLSDKDLEQQLLKFGSIKNKIARVTKLLHPRGIDYFVESLDWLRDDLKQEAPSLHVGSLAEGIQKQLFWPRNRVLHSGVEHRIAEAKECLSVGFAAVNVLREMEFVAELTALTGRRPF